MSKYNVGDWVLLYSPIKGDKNKKQKNKNIQEIRYGFIYKVSAGEKYFIQMLSNKDPYKKNWSFTRTNNQIICSRNYYDVKVSNKSIIKKTNKYKKLEEFEINKLKKLINISRKENEKNRKVYLNDKIKKQIKEEPEMEM